MQDVLQHEPFRRSRVMNTMLYDGQMVVTGPEE